MACNAIGIVAKNSLQKSGDVRSGPSGDISCEVVVGRELGLLRHKGS